jgi:hypothetical protein
VTQAKDPPLIQTLMADHARQRYKYVGVDGTGRDLRYTMEIHGRRRIYDATQTRAWLQALTLGTEDTTRTQTSVDDIAHVREVLVNPSLADSCRIAIRAAMEEEGIGPTELAERIGRTRHSISTALQFGRGGSLSMVMAQQMMAGCNRRWDVRYEGVADITPGSPQVPIAPTRTAPRAPAGLNRARALALGHEYEILRWLTPLDPSQCLRAKHFQVSFARTVYELPADTVIAWVAGLADAWQVDAVADALT